jgi:hypothetical protein
VAFAAALSPDGGERAAWNRTMLEALARRPDLDVQAFADRSPGSDLETAAFAERAPGGRRPDRRSMTPAGVPVHPLAALEAVEGLEGRFDDIVYVIADDTDSTGCLAALRRRRDGVVVARDVFLAGLYGHAARSGALPDGLAGTISGAYGDAVQPGAGAGESLPDGEARRLGLLLTRDILSRCVRLIVTRPSDATLADLDAFPADREKIGLAGPEPEAVAAAVYETVTRRSLV